MSEENDMVIVEEDEDEEEEGEESVVSGAFASRVRAEERRKWRSDMGIFSVELGSVKMRESCSAYVNSTGSDGRIDAGGRSGATNDAADDDVDDDDDDDDDDAEDGMSLVHFCTSTVHTLYAARNHSTCETYNEDAASLVHLARRVLSVSNSMPALAHPATLGTLAYREA